jgi:hypothetical protein
MSMGAVRLNNGQNRSFDVELSVFDLLNEMVKNPATVKAWRAPIADAFSDNRFFNAPPSHHARWKPLVQALLASDKERFVDLIGPSMLSARFVTRLLIESYSENLDGDFSQHLH